MKRPVRPPRFLPQVLKAICELKETGGSNSNRIVSHVKSCLNDTRTHPTPRNLSTQVQRALKHATTNGIVRQRAGKFRINAAILSPFKDCEECRRRRRRKKEGGGKKRRRRRRRHAITPDLKDSELGSDSDRPRRLFTDSDSEEFPVRQLRRRRRKKGNGEPKRRRRRRRRQHDVLRERAGSTAKNQEGFREDPVYPDDHKEDDTNIHDSRQCDNPECLCNVKDETEENQNYDPPM